jgi:hypothetical protein
VVLRGANYRESGEDGQGFEQTDAGGVMAIETARLAEGTRVRVRQAFLPLEPGVVGRSGTVIVASDYDSRRLAIALDGEDRLRVFMPEELEVIQELPLAPERQSAKLRPALP